MRMETMNEFLEGYHSKALQGILACLAKVLDLDSFLHAVIGTLTESLAARRAAVALTDELTGKPVVRASHGFQRAKKEKNGYWRGDRIFEFLAEASGPFVHLRDAADPLYPSARMVERMDRECVLEIGTPLFLSGAVSGVVWVDRIFGDEVALIEDIRFLCNAAEMIARGIGIHREATLQQKIAAEHNAILHREVAARYHSFTLLGRSPGIEEVRQLVRKVAGSNASVLLLGEHGVGKTLTARIIHEMSPRGQEPFVKVNCASLPEGALDLELFGDDNLRSTASKSRPGAFSRAEGGVIFLDDVEDLPAGLQAKLIRFLQRRNFDRSKRDRDERTDVRIIAAASAHLSEKMRLGTFKEDLYYRLNVFPIDIPPLRERPEDIPILVEHFHSRASQKRGRRLLLSSQCIDILKENEWPGNVDELENFIERLVILAGCVPLDLEEIRVLCHLHGRQAGLKKEHSLSRLEEMERKEIAAALERNRWIQSQAARELGLTLRQVGYRIKKFGLDDLVQRRKSG
mgnify:CR=1 FL=1